MIAIITYTPIWVWAVLALLVYLGILQRKNTPFKGGFAVFMGISLGLGLGMLLAININFEINK